MSTIKPIDLKTKLTGRPNLTLWTVKVSVFAETNDYEHLLVPPDEWRLQHADNEAVRDRERDPDQDKVMRGVLLNNIDDALLLSVKDLKTTHEVYTTLVKRFSGKNNATRLMMRKTFDNFQWGASKNAKDFLSGVLDAAENYRSAGGDPSDYDIASVMYNGLPDSKGYELLKISALQRLGLDPDNVDLNDEMAIIEGDELRIRSKTTTEDHNSPSALLVKELKAELREMRALVTRGRGGGGPFQGNCYNCHKPGHIARDCPEPVKDRETSVCFNFLKGRKCFRKPCPFKHEKPEQASVVAVAVDTFTPSLYSQSPTSTEHAFTSKNPFEVLGTPAADESVHSSTHKAMAAVHNKVVDSGASRTMTPAKEELKDYQPLVPVRKVSLGDNSQLEAVGVGKLVVKGNKKSNGRDGRDIQIDGAWHVPKLSMTLLGGHDVAKAGVRTVYLERTGDCVMIDPEDSEVIAVARVNADTGLYELLQQHDETETAAVAAAVKRKGDIDYWHRVLGHLGEDNLRKLFKEDMVVGATLVGDAKLKPCRVCELAMHRAAGVRKKKDATRAAELNDLVHFDLCEVEEESFSGYRYFCVFTDDHSRFGVIAFLRHKSEMFDKFVAYKAYAERLHGRPILKVRCDNAAEHISNQFRQHMGELGITYERSAPYKAQHNPVAERRNLEIANGVRCGLQDLANTLGKNEKDVKPYWAFAAGHKNDVNNSTPTRARQQNAARDLVQGEAEHLAIPQVGIDVLRTLVWASAQEVGGARQGVCVHGRVS